MRQSWKTSKKKKIQRKVEGLIWQAGNRKFYCIRATIGNIIINVIFTGKTPSINIYVYIYVVYTCRHCWSLVNSPFFFPPSFVKRLSERDAKYAFLVSHCVACCALIYHCNQYWNALQHSFIKIFNTTTNQINATIPPFYFKQMDLARAKEILILSLFLFFFSSFLYYLVSFVSFFFFFLFLIKKRQPFKVVSIW